MPDALYRLMKIFKFATSIFSNTLHYLAAKVVGEFKLRACVNLHLGSQGSEPSYTNTFSSTHSEMV